MTTPNSVGEQAHPQDDRGQGLINAARDLLDTELGELACTGSDATVEDALGRLRDALAGAKPAIQGEPGIGPTFARRFRL